MQYKPETENLGMAGGVYTPVSRPLSLEEDPQVQRPRKIFIIILSVLLGLCVLGLISSFFSTGNAAATGAAQGAKISQPIVAILIYGFGILVAYKYSQLGLRIFAWFGVIGLVLSGIGIVFLLFFAIVAVSAVSTVDPDNANTVIGASVMAFILIAVYIAMFALSVYIVRLAFRLARCIDANKRLISQQI